MHFKSCVRALDLWVRIAWGFEARVNRMSIVVVTYVPQPVSESARMKQKRQSDCNFVDPQTLTVHRQD